MLSWRPRVESMVRWRRSGGRREEGLTTDPSSLQKDPWRNHGREILRRPFHPVPPPPPAPSPILFLDMGGAGVAGVKDSGRGLGSPPHGICWAVLMVAVVTMPDAHRQMT